MSELRKELLNGRWVIIATERNKRPDDFRPAAAAVSTSPNEGRFCPFCPGNEGKTPPEVFALRGRGGAPDSPGWRIRVVPNKFPALSRGEPPATPGNGLFQAMEGVGVHEVIIENPDHGRELGDLTRPRLAEVLRVYRDRIRTIEEELHYQYVQVFKNKGREAGASLSHPHSQIIATPIAPKRIKEEIYGADRLFQRFKECYFCRLIREERDRGERIVASNRDAVALAPYASRFPFETAVYPVRHTPFFADMQDEELAGIAGVLKAVLTRLKETLFDPPYNLVLHLAPNPALSHKAWPDIGHTYHWHLEIMPILTHVAGFEYGTGFYINPVPPETAAAFLRGEGRQPEAGRERNTVGRPAETALSTTKGR